MNREVIEVKKSDFDGEHKKCNYLLAYFKANKLTIGDHWNSLDYMFWLEKKHRDFNKIYNLGYKGIYPKEIQNMFDLFLLKEY